MAVTLISSHGMYWHLKIETSRPARAECKFLIHFAKEDGFLCYPNNTIITLIITGIPFNMAALA